MWKLALSCAEDEFCVEGDFVVEYEFVWKLHDDFCVKMLSFCLQAEFCSMLLLLLCC